MKSCLVAFMQTNPEEDRMHDIAYLAPLSFPIASAILGLLCQSSPMYILEDANATDFLRTNVCNLIPYLMQKNTLHVAAVTNSHYRCLCGTLPA